MKTTKYAVIGAGAGGQSLAAILAQKGFSVRLHEIDKVKVDKLNSLGVIKVTGKIEAEGFPEVVTNDLTTAVEDADVIMIMTTTDAHSSIAKGLLPSLKDGQIILLNPGHIGGALEFRNIIKSSGCSADVVIGEAADLLYACRTPEVGLTFHSGIKNRTKVATLPAKDVSKLIEILDPAVPAFEAAENILQTSFSGAGAMLHPIPTLLNMNKIDSGVSFDYYMEGITQKIADIINEADKERLMVSEAVGLSKKSLIDTLKAVYNLEGDDLYKLLQNNKAYVGVKSPDNYNHRFIIEDTVNGLVPLSSFASSFGIKTPVIDSFIKIGSIVTGRDLYNEGRTVEKLGLSGKSISEIFEIVS